MAHPIDFFESQFQRQVREHEFALNPFEQTALNYVRGDVLDLGCGLGNLALEAERRGCTVTAIDGSATGIARICEAAHDECMAVDAVVADLGDFRIARDYDTVIAIGLLMFFRRPRALELLADIHAHVRAGGRAVVNVLIEGTTYLNMFTPGEYYLFRRDQLVEHFGGWTIEVERYDDFPAPGGSIKAFATVIARKPGGPTQHGSEPRR